MSLAPSFHRSYYDKVVSMRTSADGVSSIVTRWISNETPVGNIVNEDHVFIGVLA